MRSLSSNARSDSLEPSRARFEALKSGGSDGLDDYRSAQLDDDAIALRADRPHNLTRAPGCGRSLVPDSTGELAAALEPFLPQGGPIQVTLSLVHPPPPPPVARMYVYPGAEVKLECCR